MSPITKFEIFFSGEIFAQPVQYAVKCRKWLLSANEFSLLEILYVEPMLEGIDSSISLFVLLPQVNRYCTIILYIFAAWPISVFAEFVM